MAKSIVLNVVVIRSGECDWDRAGRLVGRADLPLGEAGLETVTVEAGVLDGVSLSTVLHGPDQCSTATAEAYARVTGAKTRSVGDLVDVDLGLWEGLLRDEVLEKFPKVYRRWEEEPGEVAVPEGEPMAEAQARLASGLARSLEKLRNPDPGVGVVLRPMAYGLIRCWLLGRPVSDVWKVAAEPAFEWHELTRDRIKEARIGVAAGG